MLVEVAARLGSGSDTVRPLQAPSVAAIANAPRRPALVATTSGAPEGPAKTLVCMRVIASVGSHTGIEMPKRRRTCRFQAGPRRHELWQIEPGLSWRCRRVGVRGSKKA